MPEDTIIDPQDLPEDHLAYTAGSLGEYGEEDDNESRPYRHGGKVL